MSDPSGPVEQKRPPRPPTKVPPAPAVSVLEDPILVAGEVALEMRASVSFAYQEIKRGRLPAFYIGRMPRVRRSALQRYLAAREAEAASS